MNNKGEELRGGLNALFGDVKQHQQEMKDSLIESLDDDELKEAIRKKQEQKIKRGRPRIGAEKKNGGPEYSRTSLIINIDKYAKIKEIAYLENLSVKDVVEASFDNLINKYESHNGEIKPQPSERHKGDINRLYELETEDR